MDSMVVLTSLLVAGFAALAGGALVAAVRVLRAPQPRPVPVRTRRED